MSFIDNKFNLLKTFIQFDFLDKKKSKLQSIKIIFQIFYLLKFKEQFTNLIIIL